PRSCALSALLAAPPAVLLSFSLTAPPTPAIYTLSLHDALPIFDCGLAGTVMRFIPPVAALSSSQIRFDGDDGARRRPMNRICDEDRKSTRLNSSHVSISYAVFCLKNKKKSAEASINTDQTTHHV